MGWVSLPRFCTYDFEAPILEGTKNTPGWGLNVSTGTMTSQSDKTPNIYIIGAQCTGKTTLVNTLAAHFQQDACPQQPCANKEQPSLTQPPKIVKEVARSVLVKHNFTAHDITSSATRCLELQTLILLAQWRAEDAATRKHPAGWFISDRSGADPMVYAQKHVGEAGMNSLAATQEWQELRERMSKSVIIVCEAGADWLLDDGVRLMPKDKQDWVGLNDGFRALLEAQGISHDILPHTMTDIGKRVDFGGAREQQKARSFSLFCVHLPTSSFVLQHRFEMNSSTIPPSSPTKLLVLAPSQILAPTLFSRQVPLTPLGRHLDAFSFSLWSSPFSSTPNVREALPDHGSRRALCYEYVKFKLTVNILSGRASPHEIESSCMLPGDPIPDSCLRTTPKILLWLSHADPKQVSLRARHGKSAKYGAETQPTSSNTTTLKCYRQISPNARASIFGINLHNM
ncbi:P-loop containing nucleoside triphosphate hydrolase [Zalerion maritima]|uniref:P-loop containing nucleoside triphosphate hydrolase n=1 Tax=Zalerion maritima TaxID=339359 RepID=A0AAD5WRM1_9PEZI|nr:P-loop containing nucleoside triphosphate hydrolase [Zalerion maritima]